MALRGGLVQRLGWGGASFWWEQGSLWCRNVPRLECRLRACLPTCGHPVSQCGRPGTWHWEPRSVKTRLPPQGVSLCVCCPSGPSVLVGRESPIPWALRSFLIQGRGQGASSFFPTWSLTCPAVTLFIVANSFSFRAMLHSSVLPWITVAFWAAFSSSEIFTGGTVSSLAIHVYWPQPWPSWSWLRSRLRGAVAIGPIPPSRRDRLWFHYKQQGELNHQIC